MQISKRFAGRGLLCTILLLIPALCFGQSFRQINDHSFKYEFGKWRGIYIGDSTYNHFAPKAKISRWAGECWMSVEYPTKLKRQPTVEGGKVKWSNPDKIEIQMFPLSEDNYQNGGFEYLIILKQKPESNQIILNIESNGVRFVYQPALTQEDIDSGAYRPDSVVGSYAVYHDTKSIMHESNTGNAEKYKAGKVGHIYRPKCYDAERAWIWADLQIADREMVITIPLDWIENAPYPLTIDPTFGYTTVGGSYHAVTDNLWTYPYDCSESGTIDSLTFYMAATVAVTDCYIIYDASNRIDYSNENTNTLSAGWHGRVGQVGGSVSSGTYYLGWFANGPSNYSWYYDTDVNKNVYEAAEYTYPPPATWSPGESAPNKKMYSVYCTYSTGAAEETYSGKGVGRGIMRGVVR